ncbi:MAG: threonine--tRNA ligase, partial [archaeon]
MKILSLHCDFLKYKPIKKAIKSPEELSDKQKEEVEVADPLGIFVAVEKTDEQNAGGLKKAVDELVENIIDLRSKVKADNVVLYPYAHLSSNLSSPQFALDVLQGAEGVLKKKKINVFRAPFGYYKEFSLKCKGHPLAELSREISYGMDKEIKISSSVPGNIEGGVKITEDGEVYDHQKLLRSISKSKLDSSKLKDNDHRILGQKLDLFSFSEVAPGMVFWHNNGWTIYNELINFWRDEHRKVGYEEISTPQILDKKLWQISGHWEKYKDNIFLTGYEGREFAVKPMNCPGGMLVFKNSPKSYKDLPLKMSELGTVHRQELSGVLAGLFRVIKFTQDDAHIFCTEEQLESEIGGVMDLVEVIYSKFGFEYAIELSTRPEKRIGDERLWDKAEKILESVLKKRKVKFKLNKGDGAFYGPKIDFHIKDSLGRTWQCATIQLDFAMPERFDLEYNSNDNTKKRPVMVHRAIFGSVERFIGILLEHLNGNLPFWLSPRQVRVLSFTDRNIKAAEKVLLALKDAGIRADGDFSSTTVNDKVRDAEMLKIPVIITIGDKEEEKKTLAVRERTGETGKSKVKFDVKLDSL